MTSFPIPLVEHPPDWIDPSEHVIYAAYLRAAAEAPRYSHPATQLIYTCRVAARECGVSRRRVQEVVRKLNPHYPPSRFPPAVSILAGGERETSA